MTAKRDPIEGMHLPAAFEPVHVATCDSAMAEAVRRARAGAPEGTLVWADAQTAARGRLESRWRSPAGGLHCAVVLRPDIPTARAGEFVALGVVALGAAIAGLVVPMTDMRYRWPNGVLLGDARTGGAWLACGTDWLVLALSANVSGPDAAIDFRQASVCIDGGNPDATAAMLLEACAYQLANWLGHWDDEGFSPVLQQFGSRAEQPREPISVCLPDGRRIIGTQTGIGDDGALLLYGDAGATRITINEYMGLPRA